MEGRKTFARTAGMLPLLVAYSASLVGCTSEPGRSGPGKEEALEREQNDVFYDEAENESLVTEHIESAEPDADIPVEFLDPADSGELNASDYGHDIRESGVSDLAEGIDAKEQYELTESKDRDDPCKGVTCDDPPEDECLGTIARHYDFPGRCDNGECIYSYHDNNCEYGCKDGTCLTCEPMSCQDAGAECGSVNDGCGGTLDCGECPAPLVCGASEPNKCGTVQADLMDVLSRSVDMQVLFKHSSTEPAVKALISTIERAGAKFGLWAVTSWYTQPFNDNYFQDLSAKLSNVHKSIPDLVMSGGLMEFIAQEAIDNTYYPAEGRNFSYEAMMPQGWPLRDHWGKQGWSVPDIRQPETQKFYIYIGKRWIDAGVEAIIFGEAQLTGRSENLNDSISFSHVIDTLRDYARQNARRGRLYVGAQAVTYLRRSGKSIIDFLEGAMHLESDSRARQVLPICQYGSMYYGDSDVHPVHPANNPDNLPVLIEFDNCCSEPPDDIHRLALWPAWEAKAGAYARGKAMAEFYYYVKAFYPMARLSLPVSKVLVGGGDLSKLCLDPAGKQPDGFNPYWFDANYCNVGAAVENTFKGNIPDPTTVEGFVRHAYLTVLAREADEAGLEFFKGKLSSGDMTRRQVLAAMFESDEYGRRNRTNEQFVADVYHSALLRGPNSDSHRFYAHDMGYWIGMLQGGASRSEVFSSILNTEEFKELY